MRRFSLLALCLIVLGGCQHHSFTTQQPQNLQPSRLMGLKRMTVPDPSREKEVEVYVWYPVAENAGPTSADPDYRWGRLAEDVPLPGTRQARPLLVLSHGFAGSPREYAWLVGPLVESGYIVMAAQHADKPGPHVNHWNRPLDLTLALDAVLGSPIGGSIDHKRIGAMGFSLGGVSVLWLSGLRTHNLDGVVPDSRYVGSTHLIADAAASLSGLDREAIQRDYRDPRIKATFLMAPAWSWIAYDQDIARIDLPVRIVAGSNDETVVTSTNAGRLARLIPGSELWIIQDAGHLVFVGEPTRSGQDNVPVHLYQDPPGVDRQYIQQNVQALALDFFNKAL